MEGKKMVLKERKEGRGEKKRARKSRKTKEEL